jgi:hypothetical protein
MIWYRGVIRPGLRIVGVGEASAWLSHPALSIARGAQEKREKKKGKLSCFHQMIND